MKDKVIFFTQNNARILVNPPDLAKFKDKPNVFINPDLTFVNGIEPHFWRLLKAKEPITLIEAKRLMREIDDAVNLADNQETHQIIFYKCLKTLLYEQIVSCEKAYDLISKLLKKANGIDRDEITTMLYDTLISHATTPERKKDNKFFMEWIKRWEECMIIPMDDDERSDRTKDVRRGTINDITKSMPQLTFLDNWRRVLMGACIAGTLIGIFLLIKR